MANLSDKQRLWIVNSTWTGSWFFFYERASWQSTLKLKTTRGVELSIQLNMPLASWPPAYHVCGFFVSERQGAWGENSWTAGEAAQADHPAQVTAGGSGDLRLRGKLSKAALLRAYSLFQDKLHWGISYLGAGVAQWLGCWTRDPKVTGSSPGRSGGKKILLQGQLSVGTLISVSIPPQQNVKDPGHSAKSAGGRLQENTHAPCVCDFAWSDTTWYMVV